MSSVDTYHPAPVDESWSGGGGDVESMVLNAVRDDPFASIREIARQVRERSVHTDVGWWRVFNVLRRRQLLSKRSRFRLVRSGR